MISDLNEVYFTNDWELVVHRYFKTKPSLWKCFISLLVPGEATLPENCISSSVDWGPPPSLPLTPHPQWSLALASHQGFGSPPAPPPPPFSVFGKFPLGDVLTPTRSQCSSLLHKLACVCECLCVHVCVCVWTFEFSLWKLVSWQYTDSPNFHLDCLYQCVHLSNVYRMQASSVGPHHLSHRGQFRVPLLIMLVPGCVKQITNCAHTPLPDKYLLA